MGVLMNRDQAHGVLDASMRAAIRLALETHEIHQKQKRKGKDIPYITHPLTVGFILALAGAEPAVIKAGILHDTMEDSVDEKKVTFALLARKFGPTVANTVREVTEPNKRSSWKVRKEQALAHLETMDDASLWVKSADLISNVSEILDDHTRDGDEVFGRFNALKADIIANYLAVMRVLIRKWTERDGTENRMKADLKSLSVSLSALAE
jgi:(p)ppGpp synthase/HD superfamily hydrolase